MKILYIGSDAEFIATALRGLRKDIKVFAGSHLDQAARCLDENPDLAALIVEGQLDGGDWRSVLTHFRALAVRPAVVVIVPKGTGSLFESLEPGADGYVEKGPSLVRELPTALTRAVSRTRGPDLEQQLVHATAALQDAERRHLAAMAGANAQIAQRQAQYEIAVARSSAIWEMVDEQLRAAALEVERARQGQASADAEADRLRHRDAEVSSLLAEAETAVGAATARTQEMEQRHESELAAASARVRELEEAFRLAKRDLQATAADIERLTKRDVELSSTLADVTTSRNDVEHRLAATEAAFQDSDADRLAASKRAAAREAELDGQIRKERETRTAFEQALADADVEIRRLTAERSETTRVLEETRRQSRETLESTVQELAAWKRTVQDLQKEVADVPRLRMLVDESREKGRRLFQQAGLAMLRCTRDGALVEANRACETLIGRRMIDDVGSTRFATAVFETPDVLSWLIERCVSTTTRGSADATWRRQDGRRLFVRLSASVVAADLIEITVEDLTRLRVLEERLNKAHRMEAVGRLASEVAATCGNLLDNIHQNAEEWMMAAGADTASRQRGELLLHDASRAAGLLRQLATCGEEQARTPRLVDLNTLVRDLEPVLKRVAGDDVDIRLRDGSPPLNVDVGIERVERLLVNLASYGRERMPFGGRLTIELGTVVVDRRFAARHPDVRLGLHALISVTETRRAAGPDRPPRRDGATERGSQGSAEARPGVDFGTLQELVSECGGHLWVRVQPPGDMIAKIRLPLLSGSHDGAGPHFRGAGVRAFARRLRN
jgi:hypothetical protein